MRADRLVKFIGPAIHDLRLECRIGGPTLIKRLGGGNPAGFYIYEGNTYKTPWGRVFFRAKLCNPGVKKVLAIEEALGVRFASILERAATLEAEHEATLEAGTAATGLDRKGFLEAVLGGRWAAPTSD